MGCATMWHENTEEIEVIFSCCGCSCYCCCCCRCCQLQQELFMLWHLVQVRAHHNSFRFFFSSLTHHISHSDSLPQYQIKLRATHTIRQNVATPKTSLMLLLLSPQHTSVNQVMLGSIFRIDEDYSARCDFNCLSYRVFLDALASLDFTLVSRK